MASKQVEMTLATAIRTAASQATGQRLAGTATDYIGDPSGCYAKVMTASTRGFNRSLVFAEGQRTAQFNGGGGGGMSMNSNVTAPKFFYPSLSGTAFQLPTDRRTGYQYASWYAKREPKIAAGIEFYKNFPLSGFKLECPSSYVKDYYEKLFKKLRLKKWLPLISQEYHRLGDCVVFTSMECEHCQGDPSYTNDKGDPCEHHGATWGSISILDPSFVECHGRFMGQDPVYYYTPTDDMIKVVTERQPQAVYDAIPPALREMIRAKQPFVLRRECVRHFKRDSAPWEPWGTSIVERLFQTLIYKDKLRQAQWLVAERHILPIKHVKIGTPERPASEDDLRSATDEMTNVANDPNLTLVTHDAFSIDYVGACHDSETEILTKRGFVFFADLLDNDIVGAVEPKTHRLVWEKPLDRQTYRYDSSVYGDMVLFESKHTNFCVTPNHELYLRNRRWSSTRGKYVHGDFEKIRADKIQDHDLLLTQLDWEGNVCDDLPYQTVPLLSKVKLDDYLGMIGWYLSEGNRKHDVARSYTYGSVWSQKSGTPSEARMRAVLDNCFGSKLRSPEITADGYDAVTRFILHNTVMSQYLEETLGNLSQNKFVPAWVLDLPVDKLQILLDTMMDGDGDSVKSGLKGWKHRYSTISKTLADNVQEIATKLGYNVKIACESKRRKAHHWPIYRVYWAEKTPTRVARSRSIYRIPYVGNVFCVTVPSGIIVTRRDGKIAIHGNSGKVLQLTNEYELIDQELIDGMMLNKAIINGDGPSYSNAQVGLVTMGKRLGAWQDEVGEWMEEDLMKPVAVWNGFTFEGERGQDEYIYPTVKWDDLMLKDTTSTVQSMCTANEKNQLSLQTLISDGFKLDWDQEVERMRQEQTLNFVGGMGGDLGAMTGGGGYGGDAPMGPDGGGDGGDPMGGDPTGAPGAPPAAGGAPPAGDVGGMPAPAPMQGAASVDPSAAYQIVASAVNNMHDQRMGLRNNRVQTRLASVRKVLSEAHRGYIESLAAAVVTGRGKLGRLDDEPVNTIGSGPDDGGWGVYPVNDQAIYKMFGRRAKADTGMFREAQRQNTQNRKLFTNLENQLYKILKSSNQPYALFAQYEAGPGMQYQLDAAIPALRLGIEADSKTYHANADQVAKDRRRDMELATQGWTVIRFTEAELNDHPQEVMQVFMTTLRKLGNGGTTSPNAPVKL